MNRCSRSRSRSGDRTNHHSQSRSRSRRWSDDRMNRRSRSRSGDRTNRHSRSRGGDSSMDRRSHSRSRNRSNRGDDMCHRTSSFNPSFSTPSFLHPMLNWLNWRTIICPFQTMHHLNSVRTMQWGHYCKLPIPTAVVLFIVVFIVVINLGGK